jgi:hypothetical protein
MVFIVSCHLPLMPAFQAPNLQWRSGDLLLQTANLRMFAVILA